MKKILFILMAVLLTQFASAQRLSVHMGQQFKDSLNISAATLSDPSIHLDKAGNYLDTSSLCDVISWGLAAASVCAFVAPKETDNDTYKNIGLVCAAAAVAAKIFSVSFDTKAGNELRLAAGSLTLTF